MGKLTRTVLILSIVILSCAANVNAIQQAVAPSAAARSTEPNDHGACLIPDDKPVSVRLREGESVRVLCENGEIKITRTPLKGRDFRAESSDGEVDEPPLRIFPDGSVTEGVEIDEVDVGDEGGDGRPNQSAMCNIKTTTYDNSIFDIRMTEYSLHLAWRWKKNNNNIKRLGAKYAQVWRERKTGWYAASDGKPIMYQKDTNKHGEWKKQGMEGTVKFNGAADLYPHEHNIILWVNRDGECYGHGRVDGKLPNFHYWEAKTFKTKYEG